MIEDALEDLLFDAVRELQETGSHSLASAVDLMRLLAQQALPGAKVTISATGVINSAKVKGDRVSPKLEWDLIPWPAMRSVAAVVTTGRNKHGDTWRSKPRRDHLNAAMRHLVCVWTGEEIDRESGLPHAAHAIARLLFALALKYAEPAKASTRGVSGIPLLSAPGVLQ